MGLGGNLCQINDTNPTPTTVYTKGESNILNLRILRWTDDELIERGHCLILIFVSTAAPNEELYVCLVIGTEFGDRTLTILILVYFFQFPFL